MFSVCRNSDSISISIDTEEQREWTFDKDVGFEIIITSNNYSQSVGSFTWGWRVVSDCLARAIMSMFWTVWTERNEEESMTLTQRTLHKSATPMETVWGERNRRPMRDIATWRWSITSCRHIFALRQRRTKTRAVSFSYIPVGTSDRQRFISCAYVLQSLDWCDGRVKISLPSFTFFLFSFSLAFSSSSSSFLPPLFFCSSPTPLLLLRVDDVCWTSTHTYACICM